MRTALFIIISLILSVSNASAQYVLVSEEYPPYAYLENSIPVGLDIEMLEAAAELSGVEIEYRFFPWARAERMVKTGEADGIFSLFKTDEREEFLIYPETHLGSERNILFASPGFDGNIDTIEDLEGLVVGTVASNSYGELFDSYTGCIKEENTNLAQSLVKLSINRTELAIGNEIVARYIISDLNLSGIKTISLDLGEAPLFVAFSKASPRSAELFEKLGNALALLEKEGKLESIRQRFIQKNVYR